MNYDNVQSILTSCRGGASVLVVDDQSAIRKLLIRYLSMRGMVAEGVGSAEDALEWIERNGPPGVLVTDLVMGGMNGYELVNRVQVEYPSVQSLFISACFQMLRKPASCDSAVCVSKPIDLPDFYETVSGMLAPEATARAV